MNIIGLCGSLRPRSSSRVILEAFGEMLKVSHSFTTHEIGDLPLFNEEEGNESVKAFRKAIGDSHAVVICTPEYAFGIPGALKNALDWTVGSGEFVNKKVILITAASHGYYGHAAMILVLHAITANLFGELVITTVRAKITDGVLTDELAKKNLLLLSEKISGLFI